MFHLVTPKEIIYYGNAILQTHNIFFPLEFDKKNILFNNCYLRVIIFIQNCIHLFSDFVEFVIYLDTHICT